MKIEAEYFLLCVIIGIGAAFMYDILRISRRVHKTSVIAVNLQDIIFIALLALPIFGAAYIKNGGELRPQGLLGAVVGAVLYALVVRNRFLRVGEAVYTAVKRVTLRILGAVLFPFRLVIRAVKKPVMIIAWHTRRSAKRVKLCARVGKTRLGLRLRTAIDTFRKK